MTVQAVSITSEGWAYLNSRTWHPTMWLGEDTDVECYEVAWDGGGASLRNGRTQGDDLD